MRKRFDQTRDILLENLFFAALKSDRSDAHVGFFLNR